MNLRGKVALATAAVGAIVAVGGAAGALVSTRQQLASQIDQTLLASARDPGGRAARPPARNEVGAGDPDILGAIRAARNGAGRPVPGDARGADCASRRGAADAAVQVLKRDGTVTSCGNVATLPIDDADVAIANATVDSPPRLRTVTVDGRDYRVVTAHIRPGIALQIARDLSETDAVVASLRARLAVLGALAIAVAAAGGWFVARRMVRPIEDLQDATDRVASTGDLSAPVKVKGTDEIAGLATSFNSMIRALATSQEQQTRLIADASHELRTPLTSLRTNAELLQRARNLTPEQHSEVVGAVVSEVDELTALMTELVELATDPTGVDEAVQDVDLAEVVADVVERTRRRSGTTITVEERNPITLQLRARMLDRAVTNLLENAVKYGASTGSQTADIMVTVDGGRVEVRDHGRGIDDADLPHVFSRFYRSISARSAPGSGLGLAIVEQIVSRHGGRVFASNAPDGGAIVGFAIPDTVEGVARRRGTGPEPLRTRARADRAPAAPDRRRRSHGETP